MANDEDDLVDEVDDADAEPRAASPSRGPQPPRLSITLNEKVRKKLRLAAALSDMEPNEWARVVLAQVAKRTVEKRYPDRV